MTNEIGFEDCLVIHARSFLAGFAGLSGMLEELLRAHDELEARGTRGPQPPAHGPLLQTARDVMHIVVNACQHIAEPCNAALDPGAMNPMLSIAVNDSMAILSDLIERLSVRLELPIGQWLTELVVGHVPRDDWPALWRLSVWLGAMLHHAEDAAVTLQALMQFLAMGSIFETRRVGGEWLNEQGALAALDYYRRMPPQARMALQVDVSQACAYALLALAEASKARAEQAAAVADSMLAAHYLDAKDVVHLGVHSQIARRGGVFLSHRGKDAKRPLMDFHHAARPEIFLDIWARPAGDTNRRFLWRNLAAAGEMHAFVTANYAMSDFCMKEVEAWGVLSLARGHTAAETPGRFFVIDDAATGPANAVLCAWTQHCREDTTLTHAMTASAEALGSCGVLGTRIVHSMEEKDASDSFNRVLLGTDLLQDATLPVIELSREPIEALIGLFHRGLAILRNKGELSHELIRTIEHALPQEVPASGAAFVAMLRTLVGRLLEALNAYPAGKPVMRCTLLALAALAEVAAHVVRHWNGGTPEEVGRSLIYFTKFGAVIDSVAEQFTTWCIALATACFDVEGDDKLFAGLVVGLLPIDHEAAEGTLRVDADFCVAPAPTLPQALEAAGLTRRTVQVVCTSTPTFWQRVAVIAALSSFTSRSFLFIDVEGSGALTARVGELEMQEFPHVTLQRIEDLPPL